MMDNERRGYTIPESHRNQERELPFSGGVPEDRSGSDKPLPMKETPQIKVFLDKWGRCKACYLTKFSELMQFMQEDFGFKQTNRLSVRNNPETVYEYVTLAERRAA
jgi:hypothetical protein